MKILKITFPLVFFLLTNLKAQISIHLSQSCDALDRSKTSESFLITFDPSEEARGLTKAIMDVAGIASNFELRFANIDQLEATSDQGKRYLLYSTQFLRKFDQDDTYWGTYFMLAHEIGHHLKKHEFELTDPDQIKYNELEADAFAGAALCMLGASLQETLEGVAFLSIPRKTEIRPAKSSRLEAVALGWKRQYKKLNRMAHYNIEPFEADIELNGKPSEQAIIQRVKEAERSNGHGAGNGGKAGNGAASGGSGENPFGKSNGSGGGTGTLIPQFHSTTPLPNTKMPDFPWPPPNCFQRKTLVKNLSAKAQSFEDIDERLQRALDAAGYYQRSYYKTPNGFALVTQMEQFAPDGQIKNRFRWADYPVQEDFDGVWDYFKSLIMPEPGRFRVFVFVVTNEVYGKSDQKFDQMKVRGLATSGYSQMPSAYAQSSVTKDHYLEALIYEFEAPQSTKKCTEKCPAHLDIQTHLTQSGLLGIIGF